MLSSTIVPMTEFPWGKRHQESLSHEHTNANICLHNTENLNLIKKGSLQGEAVGVSRRQSLDGAAIAERNSSTCFKDKELWRVSKGHMEGTMEYSSNPEKYTHIYNLDSYENIYLEGIFFLNIRIWIIILQHF